MLHKKFSTLYDLKNINASLRMDQLVPDLLSTAINEWASFAKPYFELYQFGSNLSHIECPQQSNKSTCKISNDVLSTFVHESDVSTF